MNLDLLIERVLLSRLAHALAGGADIESARENLRSFYRDRGMYA